MRTQIIQIGNSQGIRIPKILLEDTGIIGDVELERHPDGILIRNAQQPRSGWADAFRQLAGDDEESDEPAPTTDFEKKGWRW